ncbi:cation/calcium exchanger 2 [Malania oleifera]|uniref:cation/calcium exchanger 2 n=1 Tax=Malania oleifera TaxID=397392 RepID=UPI0025AE5178|nr:cation/calcium exchanger 2 [Malania oleifera]
MGASSLFTSEPNRYLVLLNLSFLLLASFFIKTQFQSFTSSSESVHVLRTYNPSSLKDVQGCEAMQNLENYEAKCSFLKSNTNPCVSQGYIDYLRLYYCTFGEWPLLCCSLLFLWLIVLFYLLGNTASEYFCSSLENLSRLLKLSPTIAGVTLLSLGNGASDVFASLVSFMGSGTGNVGLSTVLGGASFISCVVVGVISFSLQSRRVSVNKSDFVRDVCFFLLAIVSLIAMLIVGEISIWVALGYSSIYLVYVFVVYVSHFRSKNANENMSSELGVPILGEIQKVEVKKSSSCGIFYSALAMPLHLPRRLTIPVVSEERWSKPFAITSAALAPLLLSALWVWEGPEKEYVNLSTVMMCGVGIVCGMGFGILAFLTTEGSNPPKKGLFPWLAGGFLMSVTWSYMTAQELVGLLVSFGYIYGISPSILGLTVLAWGNSLGDLITNLTMAVNGGPEGAQMAISGCYAGPIFNILVGLGFSLVGSSWYMYPSSVVIPTDPYLLETMAFMVGALVWALVILPRRNMRLDGVLGAGLLALYFVSLSLRLIQTVGLLQLPIFHQNPNA